jgi:hypothetical protein
MNLEIKTMEIPSKMLGELPESPFYDLLATLMIIFFVISIVAFVICSITLLAKLLFNADLWDDEEDEFEDIYRQEQE